MSPHITISYLWRLRDRGNIFLQFGRSFATFRPRIYLEVPYAQKDECKAVGGKWDFDKKKWYIDDLTRLKLVRRWNAAERTERDVSQKKVDKTVKDDKNSNVKASQSIETKRKLVLDSNHKAIFFDLETNGLPGSANNPDRYDTSRIIQVSYMLCDCLSFTGNNTIPAAGTQPLSVAVETADESCTPEVEDVLVRADGFRIDNTHIHGITLERSLAEGLHFAEVVTRMTPAFKQAQFLVAHNAAFDVPVLMSELRRYGHTDLLSHIETMTVVCTMKRTKPLLKLPMQRGGLKNPNLKELFTFATGGEALTGHHDARQDVVNLHRAMRLLAKRGVLSAEDLFSGEEEYDSGISSGR